MKNLGGVSAASVVNIAYVVAATLGVSIDARAFDIPTVSGLIITEVRTAEVPGAIDTQAFQFDDGRIVVEAGAGRGIWSSNGGYDWTPGVQGPSAELEKAAIDLGNGEILSISRTSQLYPSPPPPRDPNDACPDTAGSRERYYLVQKRSLDNWETVQCEKASLSTPEAVAIGGDAGETEVGMLMHHGLIRLRTGDLMATLFGNYASDKELAEQYPAAYNFRKYRAVVVFSSDNGRTWHTPITVARSLMLASDNQVALADTQEGFSESDTVSAPNGDILVFMRSGGILPDSLPRTDLYMARSCDEGRTWLPPKSIANDVGVNPQAVVLGNGVIVVTYARPDGWVMFSDNNGDTWKGAFRVSDSESYTNIFKINAEEFMVLYFGDGGKVYASHFNVRRTGSAPSTGSSCAAFTPRSLTEAHIQIRRAISGAPDLCIAWTDETQSGVSAARCLSTWRQRWNAQSVGSATQFVLNGTNSCLAVAINRDSSDTYPAQVAPCNGTQLWHEVCSGRWIHAPVGATLTLAEGRAYGLVYENPCDTPETSIDWIAWQ